MTVHSLAPVQRRLLTQETLTAFRDHGRWLSALIKNFQCPIDAASSPAVFLYGSAVSGTAFNDGDADYAVLFANKSAESSDAVEHRFVTVERDQQENVLSSLHAHLQAQCKEEGIDFKSQRIFRARVPIIKCVTGRTEARRQFDISLSADGVKNSLLLRQYMQGDPRLRAGALCIKEWGRSQQILNARHGWISPYALTIMYVFYAQRTGVTNLKCDETGVRLPPVLDAVVTNALDGRSTEPSHSLVAWQEVDPDVVLEDARGFFRFFSSGEFDFDNDVVDIRTSGAIRTKDDWKARLGNMDERELWHLLGHEVLLLRDPFESHNLGRSVDFFKAESIRERLRIAGTADNLFPFLESSVWGL